MTKGGMSGHTSPVNQTPIWLTPRFIIKALGPFDVDPCAAPEPRPWDTARRHIGEAEDGLKADWGGGGSRVWLNPPYGGPSIVKPWLRRMADHGHGTALIFARTETEAFFEFVWNRATAVLFLQGRLTFIRPNGEPADHNGGAPSALVAYGQADARRLRYSGLAGAYVPLANVTTQLYSDLEDVLG